MKAFWIWIVLLICGCVIVSAEPDWRKVELEPSGWHCENSTIEIKDEALLLRPETGYDGFALVQRQPCRREVALEADIRMTQRLSRKGWSLAGITLYQDFSNYWMLSLVSGPDGKRSFDFIEKHDGIWQAQSQGRTTLKREGSLSLDWNPDELYRLRLEMNDSGIRASVCSVKTGAVLGNAAFRFENKPAVRGGWPGLIVRECGASVSRVDISGTKPQQKSSDASSRKRVAILDDDFPGHDRSANARLAESLIAAGFQVECLSYSRMISPRSFSGDLFQLAVIPCCDSVPAFLHETVINAVREGIGVIFLGGPFLDRELCSINGRWLDHAGQNLLLQKTEISHQPFVIGSGLNTKSWNRACQDGSNPGQFRIVKEGPDGESCLRYNTENLVGWDVWHSPKLENLFGEGDGLFCFDAKGDGHTRQLAVEIAEKDGSRWIATAELTDQWNRVILRLSDFKHWKDSSTAKNRGEAGDCLNPLNAERMSFGLSASHTPVVNSGRHTLWISGIGTAPDPLKEINETASGFSQPVECVTPRYKVYNVTGPADVRDATPADGGGKVFLKNATDLVCAIPRALGEGFNRNSPWRFISYAQVSSAGVGQQVCEWMLAYNRFPLEGRVIAGLGYCDPAVWSSPPVLARINAMARRMTGGVIFKEAGSDQFACRPGEPLKLGAKIYAFDPAVKGTSINIDVHCSDKTVFSRNTEVLLKDGAGALDFNWQPPRDAALYRVTVSLKSGGILQDQIQHEFAVIDSAPAPKNEFAVVSNGNFIINGKKWYPVGVNFWPLYVSGMEPHDYTAGWLKDFYYSPALVECDLKHMEDMGINLVSIQTPPVEHYRNLLDFLRRCRRHGIYANLYVSQASPVAFNDRDLSRYMETARLSGNSTVFAYDTIWEPGNHLFKNDSARAGWDQEWRAWIEEQYGSVANAEKWWGCKARRSHEGAVMSPPDKWFRTDGDWRRQMAAYRRFMDNATSRLWGAANRRLRELDPNHLVSFRQGNTLPYDFALSGPVKHIDFICPEGYAVPNSDQGEAAIGFITRYTAFTTAGKPVIWSEFGKSVWNAKQMTWSADAIMIQGEYSARFYRTALESGANGTIPWWWPGGYRVNERSDFGIIEPDRNERPAARLIRDYASRFKQPREMARPDEWLVYDRDAHSGGYCWTAFHEGADAYRKAKEHGHLLGIKTQGTGTTSVDVPLVAVGNVPCDGTNPPKYLDAEFNWFQVRGKDGKWREIKDGDELSCTSGNSLSARISLGNLQESLWIPPTETGKADGGVALVLRSEGRVVASLPLKQRVAYLQDADFGECVLMKNISESVQLTARLEALGRTPFGESRVFSLKTE